MNQATLYQAVADNPRFIENIQRKSRFIWLLTIVSLGYYFALLLGAAYFRPLFGTIVAGHVNLGMLFAFSQYLFAGVIAIIYANFMKKIDATMHDIVASHPAAKE
jgi:uncharacterized membrane protein (DUF485 family)